MSDRSLFIARPWLALVVILGLCVPPLLVDLNTRITTHTMEQVALVVSQETWLRWHSGDSSALLVTYNDDRPRVEKPPMVTWINFLAWADLSPDSATPVQLTHRARLASIAMGLMLVASVFWAGMTLGGARMAIVAALAAGSMWFLQRQARCASYDIHFVSWAALAAAAGLWAMSLNSEAIRFRRRVIGWGVCGLAIAASMLSKNPLALLIATAPLIGAVAVMREQRLRNAIGLCTAVCVALIPVGLWYWHLLATVPGALHRVMSEFKQPRDEPQPFYFYGALVALMLPWSIWLACGLVQPFSALQRSDRRRLLIPWLWFAIILLFFSILPAKQQRYILPIVPAAALLVAQFIGHLQRVTDDGTRDRPAEWVSAIHWVLLLVLSVAGGPFLAAQEWIVQHAGTWYSHSVVEPLSWPGAAAMTLVLLMIVAAGWRSHASGRYTRSAVLMAVWMLAVTTVFWHCYAGLPTRITEYKLAAERVASVVGDAPLRSLRLNKSETANYMVNEEFRFYYGRLIRHILPNELIEYSAKRGGPVYVLTKPDEPHSQTLREAGFREIDHDVRADKRKIQALWVK